MSSTHALRTAPAKPRQGLGRAPGQVFLADYPIQIDRYGDEQEAGKGAGGATNHHVELVPHLRAVG